MKGPGHHWLLASILALMTLWTVGAAVLPWLQAEGRGGAALVRFAYAPVCHQMDGRCLSVAELPMAVCARCFGLYLGATVAFALALGGAVRLSRRTGVRLLLVALVPTLADVAAKAFGAGLANIPRFSISLPLGAVLGFLLYEGLVDALARSPRPRALAQEISGGGDD